MKRKALATSCNTGLILTSTQWQIQELIAGEGGGGGGTGEGVAGGGARGGCGGGHPGAPPQKPTLFALKPPQKCTKNAIL